MKEQSVKCVRPRGASFQISRGGEPVEHLYTDRECTCEYEGDDGAEALELYVK